MFGRPLHRAAPCTLQGGNPSTVGNVRAAALFGKVLDDRLAECQMHLHRSSQKRTAKRQRSNLLVLEKANILR